MVEGNDRFPGDRDASAGDGDGVIGTSVLSSEIGSTCREVGDELDSESGWQVLHGLRLPPTSCSAHSDRTVRSLEQVLM